MGEMDIAGATASDLSTAMDDYSVSPEVTDGPAEQKETRWMNTNWTQDLGYLKKIPELRSAVLTFARWTIGRGYEAEPETELILMGIKGWGKDNFNGILKNMVAIGKHTGDAYCEIITDPESGVLINLKPLDNGQMVHIVNNKGMLIRYELVSKIKGQPNKKFKPWQIFHLCFDRAADEIHGTGMAEALEWTILARNEAMTDYRELMHRHVRPRFKYSLEEDDETKVAAFKVKEDEATAKGENIYVPKNAVEVDLITVAPNSTLDPKTWVNQLGDNFYKVIGVPQIIVGGSSEFTEASAKIAYLAWQQTVEELQLEVETQVLNQLNLEIKLTFPASLENETINTRPTYDEQNQAGINPPEIQQNETAFEGNDRVAETEGRR